MSEQSEIAFAVELYLEHLEEASFLYQQRLTLLADIRMEWSRIEEFEERLQAHLDALDTGGEEAFEICANQGVEGDAGALFAAVCIFCRQGRNELVWKVTEGLDPQIEERLQAVSDALRYELPDFWGDELVRRVVEKRPNARLILARTAGYRRLPEGAGSELLKNLPGEASQATSVILDALGRLRYLEAGPARLDQCLASENESIHANAAKTLLLLGERKALQDCLQFASLQTWPDSLLGISAGRSALAPLMKKAAQKKPKASPLIGLGLLGDISAVEILLGCLVDQETAEAAALALNLMTGAEIYEEAFIPDEIDEDELFPEELEKFRQGQLPTRPDGRPYGVTITRLSQKPQDWQEWWTNNISLFKAGIRYRNGKPYDPECLLNNLENPKSPCMVRKFAYEELVIRYGVALPFEADMLVVEQKKALAKISQWVKNNSNRFQSGVWYFAGQIIS